MSAPSEDFEELRKLLALKRHEQPPPGYFNELPDRIMMRLQRGQEESQTTWWRRLLAAVELRPALPAAFGLAVLGLYLVGLNLTRPVDPGSGSFSAPVAKVWPAPAAAPVGTVAIEPPPKSLTGFSQSLSASSMDPVGSDGPPPGLFAPGAGMRLNDLHAVRYNLRRN